jgi:uncharacterized protein YjbJ (UPF0337 family)
MTIPAIPTKIPSMHFDKHRRRNGTFAESLRWPVDPFAGSIRRDWMDKDRIKGSFEQAKGAVKEGVGKATGDEKLEAEGKAEKAAGKVRNTVGGIKDIVRGE